MTTKTQEIRAAIASVRSEGYPKWADDAYAELAELEADNKALMEALAELDEGLRGDLPITRWAKEIVRKALEET